MKRHGNLFNKIIDYDNLYYAYTQARKGKRWQKGILDFEKDIKGNLLKLQQSLINKTFTTSSYRVKTIYEPKKREIYILPFYPDRILQHALLQVVSPLWNNLMIHQSYACRPEKGMHQASRKLMKDIQKYDYCLKCDISKFYPSIDHDIIMRIVERKIKCKDTLWLLNNIIYSFPNGKNTPIGNYTSQWFGNLYMNELDTYVKHELKIKSYARYCDDFILLLNDKKELHRLKDLIDIFIHDKLLLKFSKWSVFNVNQGIDYLGYRHFRSKILLRKTTSKRVKKRFKILLYNLLENKISLDAFGSSIASSMGWLKWANTYNLRVEIKLKQLKELYEGLSKAYKQQRRLKQLKD